MSNHQKTQGDMTRAGHILKIALSHALCKVKLLCLNLMLHPFNVDQACGSQPGEPQQRNCRERYGGICDTGVA
eukprot:6198077-Pleurochrysis_carterae.AAC.2